MRRPPIHLGPVPGPAIQPAGYFVTACARMLHARHMSDEAGEVTCKDCRKVMSS